jgi:D-alanyl-D-alanine carboxypeptidase (penicillin-binding protein 5/6)
VALTRRQIFVRRRIAVFGSLALLLGVAFYLPMTLLAPLAPATAVVTKPNLLPADTAKLSWPGYGGSAIGAVGFDGVLGQAGATTPLPMASITKVVTALVVLDAKPLTVGEEGPKVTMTAADVALYRHYLSLDGKVASVRPGLVFTQHELLQIALIDSANNYAASLAVWAFGSEDAYVTAARAWVAKHQLTSMTITEPTGIDPADAANTADLISLGKLALADPVISAIVRTPSITIHDIGAITNTNDLLGSSGVDGIKTGTLNTSGANLLFSADYPVGGSTVTVVGVVLGGSDHAQLDVDIRALLDGVKAGFHEVTLARTGQVYARYTTGWGQQVTAVAKKSARVVTWSDTAVTSTVTAKPVTTGTRGEDVGSIVFRAAGQTVSVPIELSRTISDPGAGWRLAHPGLLVGAP